MADKLNFPRRQSVSVAQGIDLFQEAVNIGRAYNQGVLGLPTVRLDDVLPDLRAKPEEGGILKQIEERTENVD